MTGSGGGLSDRLGSACAAGRKLLIPFLTAGYPDPTTSARALKGVAAAGADAIEIGVPFSDPLADGPTIAAASQQALEGGASLAGAIELGAGHAVSGGAPANEAVPLVLFTYLNPLDAFGPERAAEACQHAGFGGVLVADLPFDEDPAVANALAVRGLPLIRLAAPTTPAARLRSLGAGAEGFVYLIARTGVTGAGGVADRRAAEQVRILRETTQIPIVLGFGIGDVDQARRAAAVADGIVVGSALVERLGRHGPRAAADWVAELRTAIDKG
ncbi:MAG: tryptophan synthase subunit alpha [Gemmatimonadetes bacterium]|nr:tryptophan synthase subunit alpha [Gemmatimonadota bacterium]